jgi:hypothetical protein
MKFSEIIKLPVGTKVFRIKDGVITSFTFLALHPKYPEKYAYFINNLSVEKSVGFYIPHQEEHNTKWEIEPEKANEIMWEQMIENLKAINEIYFKNKNHINISNSINE